MTNNVNGFSRCPRCQREVSTRDRRYTVHSPQSGSSDYCPMSKQHVHINELSATAYYSRAVLVGNLAAQLRDEDPEIVWGYLETLPPWELQRIAMVALAAVPIDQTVTEIFSWVTEFPVNRFRETA